MFGSNKSGQLGLALESGLDCISYPTVVPGNFSVSNLCCGSNHSVILTEDRRVLSAGSNMESQLGIVSTKDLAPKPKVLSSAPAAKEKSKQLRKEKSKQLRKEIGKRGVSPTTRINSSTLGKNSIMEPEELTPVLPPTFFVSVFTELEFFRDKKVAQIICNGNSTAILTKKTWIADAV
ncbi:alpha tubulin suppressor [Bonamia ostreae]|uniref:Alpha tubulin suppressor n=1 Tax=Bonamia ostreae TaxID=126728 RepID=A0ABV2AP26_9EUKA